MSIDVFRTGTLRASTELQPLCAPVCLTSSQSLLVHNSVTALAASNALTRLERVETVAFCAHTSKQGEGERREHAVIQRETARLQSPRPRICCPLTSANESRHLLALQFHVVILRQIRADLDKQRTVTQEEDGVSAGFKEGRPALVGRGATAARAIGDTSAAARRAGEASGRLTFVDGTNSPTVSADSAMSMSSSAAAGAAAAPEAGDFVFFLWLPLVDIGSEKAEGREAQTRIGGRGAAASASGKNGAAQERKRALHMHPVESQSTKPSEHRAAACGIA